LPTLQQPFKTLLGSAKDTQAGRDASRRIALADNHEVRRTCLITDCDYCYCAQYLVSDKTNGQETQMNPESTTTPAFCAYSGGEDFFRC
jgi:hypothetical protein